MLARSVANGGVGGYIKYVVSGWWKSDDDLTGIDKGSPILLRNLPTKIVSYLLQASWGCNGHIF